MIEALKSEKLVKNVGGPFRLTALIQRRLKELIEGARPLVDTQGKNMVEIAIQEVAEGKVVIDYDKCEMLEPPDQEELETEIHEE